MMIHTNSKPISFVIILFLISCNSLKLTTKKPTNPPHKEGYTFGIIKHKDTGNCGWIISDSKNINYDPINIKEDEFLPYTFKKNKIYFKFLPLRMKNRCENVFPIKLIEIIPYTD
ncbi:hypothetical protein N9750_01520 [Polaribacter sp.]|nr:hypothetical protein [Polaribacter sp.]